MHTPIIPLDELSLSPPIKKKCSGHDKFYMCTSCMFSTLLVANKGIFTFNYNPFIVQLLLSQTIHISKLQSYRSKLYSLGLGLIESMMGLRPRQGNLRLVFRLFSLMQGLPSIRLKQSENEPGISLSMPQPHHRFFSPIIFIKQKGHSMLKLFFKPLLYASN